MHGTQEVMSMTSLWDKMRHTPQGVHDFHFADLLQFACLRWFWACVPGFSLLESSLRYLV